MQPLKCRFQMRPGGWRGARDVPGVEVAACSRPGSARCPRPRAIRSSAPRSAAGYRIWPLAWSTSSTCPAAVVKKTRLPYSAGVDQLPPASSNPIVPGRDAPDLGVVGFDGIELHQLAHLLRSLVEPLVLAGDVQVARRRRSRPRRRCRRRSRTGTRGGTACRRSAGRRCPSPAPGRRSSRSRRRRRGTATEFSIETSWSPRSFRS